MEMYKASVRAIYRALASGEKEESIRRDRTLDSLPQNLSTLLRVVRPRVSVSPLID